MGGRADSVYITTWYLDKIQGSKLKVELGYYLSSEKLQGKGVHFRNRYMLPQIGDLYSEGKMFSFPFQLDSTIVT